MHSAGGVPRRPASDVGDHQERPSCRHGTRRGLAPPERRQPDGPGRAPSAAPTCSLRDHPFGPASGRVRCRHPPARPAPPDVVNHLTPRTPWRTTQMLTLTGNDRLTRTPALRTTPRARASRSSRSPATAATATPPRASSTWSSGTPRPRPPSSTSPRPGRLVLRPPPPSHLHHARRAPRCRPRGRVRRRRVRPQAAPDPRRQRRPGRRRPGRRPRPGRHPVLTHPQRGRRRRPRRRRFAALADRRDDAQRRGTPGRLQPR